jgi:hypothetical protein
MERIVPERVGYGHHAVKIAWSPLGRALVQLREMMTAA